MPKKTGKGRVVFRIEISKAAEEKIEDIRETLGITQISIFSKLIKWFADQPLETKQAILDSLEGVEDGVGERVIRKMASASNG